MDPDKPSGQLRPPGGFMELIFTKLINLVPLEQCHHKPMRMYGGDHHGFVMVLVKGIKFTFSEDKLHRLPMVVLAKIVEKLSTIPHSQNGHRISK